VSACQAQLKGCQTKAVGVMDVVFEQEKREMNALTVEYKIVGDFVAEWAKKLGKAPKGSSQRASAEARINELLMKQAVIAKEMRMFNPVQIDFHNDEYKKKMKDGWNKWATTGDATALFAQDEKGFIVRPAQRQFTWNDKQRQERGTVVLGKGVLGPMTVRRKVVLKDGKDHEAADNPDLKLKHESCSELQHGILIDPQKILGPPFLFLSKETKKRGGQASTVLTEDKIWEMWGKTWDGKRDPVHKVKEGFAGTISIQPRHPVDCRFLAALSAAPYKWDKKSVLPWPPALAKTPWPDGLFVGEGKSPAPSLNVGPEKKPTVPVLIGKLNPNDEQPNKIYGKDGKVRATGTIKQWFKQPGEAVHEGDVICSVDILQSNHADRKREDWAKVEEVKAPATGLLTGLCPFANEEIWLDTGNEDPEQYFYVVNSFDLIAEIDVGEPGWRDQILPVDEWTRVF